MGRPPASLTEHQIAEVETRNCGKIIVESRNDVTASALCFEYYASLAQHIRGEQLPMNGPLLDYTTRENEYGNEVGQGVEVNQLHVNLGATWQLRQNVFIDANLLHRNADAALNTLDRKTTMATLGFRWNIAPRVYEF